MINITINGVERKLKSELNEISVAEFETVCSILATEEEEVFEKYIKLFTSLGLTEEDFDSFSTEEFINLTRIFSKIEWESTEFKKEIVINGVAYTAYEGSNYILSVRDLSKIESYVRKNNKKYLGEILAIVYKDRTQPRSEWYSEEQIALRAELFREHLTAEVVLPYINLILKDVILKLKNGTKGPTE